LAAIKSHVVQDLEERPLTSLTARMCKATVYDEPPEK
jgi:hypothetical protein